MPRITSPFLVLAAAAVMCLCLAPAAHALPTVSVDDVRVVEGDSGTTTMRFVVRFSEPASRAGFIEYEIVPGTATADVDYGLLLNRPFYDGREDFARGATELIYSLGVFGDAVEEPDETVVFRLTRVSGGRLGDDREGEGVIVDDDGPRIVIPEARFAEGNDGEHEVSFTVNVVPPSSSPEFFTYVVEPGTAAGRDFRGGRRRGTIPAGAGSVRAQIRIHGDREYGDDETLFVRVLEDHRTSLPVATPRVEMVIENDDPPPGITVEVGDLEGVEPDEGGLDYWRVGVLFSPRVEKPVTLAYSIVPGTAVPGVDYVASSSVVWTGFRADSPTILVIGDDVPEEDETIRIVFSDPAGIGLDLGDFATEGVEVVIRDNDSYRARIGDPDPVDEGDSGRSSLRFPVFLNYPSPAPVSVSWATGDGTALAGSDYESATGTLVFAPGSTSTWVDVAVLGDAVPEPDETVFLRLTGIAGEKVVFDGDPVPGVVLNDDFVLSIGSGSALEGGSGETVPVAFTVRLEPALSASSLREVRVGYSLRSGTARVPGDVVPKSGVLSFAPGRAEETFTVLVRGDDVPEPDETFHVVLSDPVGASLAEGSATGTGTVLNDDNRIVFSPSGISEGSRWRFTGHGIPFEVVPPADHDVSFRYGMESATARHEFGDYTRISGGRLVSAGRSGGEIPVDVFEDLLHEGDETFVLRLWDATGAVLESDGVVVTILDDDAPPVASFDSPEVFEGGSGTSTALRFTGTLDTFSGVEARVDYAVVGGATGTLVWPPTVTEAVIEVPVDGDDAFGPDEEVVVVFSDPVHVVLATSTARGLVRDDDARPLVSVSAPEAYVHEGGDAVFVVALSGPSSFPVEVSYSLLGSATSGVDYVAPSGVLTIPAGGLSREVRVSFLEDGVVESDEDLVLALSGVGDRASLDAGRSSARVVVRDGVVPVLSVRSVRVKEGDAGERMQASFVVELDRPVPHNVEAKVRFVEGSATPGTDHDAVRYSSFRVGILGGSTSTSFVLDVIGDDEVESDEGFSLVLFDPVGAVLGTATGTAVIVDDDGPFFSVVGGEVLEGGDGDRTPFRFRLLLSEPSGEEARISWRVRDGTAMEGRDFVFEPRLAATVVFPPGVVERFVEVMVLGDTSYGADKDFLLRLSGPEGARLSASSTARGVIRNDDAAPRFQVRGAVQQLASVGPLVDGAYVSTVLEGASGDRNEAVFEVLKAGRADETVSIGYRTVPGTGVPGVDYAHVSGRLAFAPDHFGGHSVSVPVIGNDVPEGDRTFFLELHDPVGGPVVDGTKERALGVVVDDDLFVEVGDAASVVEGDSGSTTTLSFPITLSRPSTGETHVVYSTAVRSYPPYAQYGEDHVRLLGVPFVFPPGATSTMVDVVVLGDDVGEPDELVRLVLRGASGGVVRRDVGEGWILTDDAPLHVSLRRPPGASSVVSEAATSTGMVFSYVIDRPSPFPVYVFHEYGGDAVRNVDFTGPSGKFEIPAGATSVDVTVFPLDDADLEALETLTVTITDAENAVPHPDFGSTTWWLDDDDVPVRVSGPAFVDEPALGSATTAVFRVTLDEPVQRAVHVWYELEGTAKKGRDYTFDPPHGPKGRLLFLPRKTEVEVPFRILGDGIPEDEETIVLRLTKSNGPTAVVDTETVLRIRDHAVPVMPMVDSPEVGEGSGGPLVFRLSLDRVSGEDFSLDYRVEGGTASPGVDFIVATGTAVVPAGSTSTTVGVPVLDDALYEGDETVVLSLEGPFAGVSGTGTILEDDAAPELRVSPSSPYEGDVPTTWAFSFSLDRDSGAEVRVGWSLGGGTATMGVDYAAASGTVVIPAGSRYGVATTTLYGDSVHEGDETLFLRLDSIEGASVRDREVLGTIMNDDDPPVLHVGGLDVVEGSGLPYLFRVELDGETELPVSLDYATEDRVGDAGLDYVAATGSLVFLPGERVKEVPVVVLDDDLHESEENLELVFSNISGASVGVAMVFDILDDDPFPVLTLSPGEAVEGAAGSTTTLSFVLSLSEVSGRTTGILYDLVDGTALEGEDYVDGSVLRAGEVWIPEGAASSTLDVVVLGDDLHEGDETFSVVLRAMSGATTTPSGREATGTIRDDDGPPLVSVSGGGVVSESASGTAFTVSLSEISGLPVPVAYLVGGTAEPGGDYAPLPGTLVIPSGELSVRVEVVPLDDALYEGDETVVLNLFGAGNALVDGSATSSTAVILDDDFVVVSVGHAEPVVEGEGDDLVFPVVLSESSSSLGVDLGLSFRRNGGSATEGDDYVLPLSSFVIPAGATGTEVRVAVLDDDLVEGVETLFLFFEGGDGVRFLDRQLRGRILDDDSPSLVLSMEDAFEGSGGGTSSGPVIRAVSSMPLPGDVLLTWEVVGGTAVHGEDYPRLSDAVSIPSGATSAEVLVPVVADDVLEPDETMRVRVLVEGPAVVRQRHLQAVIRNDDALLSVMGASVGEGDSGDVRELSFLMELSNPVPHDVRADYSVIGGTAASGTDYEVLPAGEILIPVGETSAWVAVSVLGDDVSELDETVVLGLSDPVGTLIGTATSSGVIYNDDVPVLTLVAVPDSVVEGGSGSSTPVVFRAVLDGPSPRETEVGYVLGFVTDPRWGEPLFNSDYRILGCVVCSPVGRFVFAPGEVLKELVLEVRDDERDERAEAFAMVLSGPLGLVLGTATGVPVVIEDDDAALVSVTADPGRVFEGDSGSSRLPFRFDLSNPLWRTGVSVLYGLEGTAVLGEDYEVSGDRLVREGVWESRFGVSNGLYRRVWVDVLGDGVLEPDETVVLRVLETRGIGFTGATSATVVIANDDASGISVVDAQGSEGDGELVFPVVLDAPASSEVLFSYGTLGGLGTAVPWTDYVPVAGQGMVSAGATGTQVMVPLLDDDVLDGDRTVVVEIADVVLGDGMDLPVLRPRATGAVRDDEAASLPHVSFDDTAGVIETLEGALGATSSLSFSVVLSATSSSEISVRYFEDGGSALVGGDYVLPYVQELVFAPGEMSRNLVASVLGDDGYAPDEDLVLRLAAPVGAVLGGVDTAQGWIRNDDPLPVFSVADARFPEGSGGGLSGHWFGVRMDGLTEGPTPSVELEVVEGGTATYGLDYDVSFGRVYIGDPGVEESRFRIEGDDTPEGDETFHVRLLEPEHGTVGTSTAVVTIVDDDAGLVVDDVEVSEGASGERTSLSFPVRLTVPSRREVRVGYEVVPGSATAGMDYERVRPGELVFAPGETATSVDVVVLGDDLDEQDEVFVLILSDATGAVVVDGAGDGVILDDDVTPVVSAMPVGSGDPFTEEDGDEISFRFLLSEASSIPVSIPYSWEGTATAGEDYVGATGTVVVPAGSTSTTVSVRVLDDVLSEPAESVIPVLGEIVNGTPGEGFGAMIVDNDLPSLSLSPAEVSEGDGGERELVFPLALSNPRVVPVEVDYAVTGGTATAGVDFRPVSGTAVFPALATSTEVRVPVFGDVRPEADETVLLSVEASLVGPAATATGTILNDDDPAVVSLSPGGPSVVEGATGTAPLAFDVSVSVPVAEVLRVSYDVGGTAASGTDYAAPPGVVEVPAGAVSAVVAVDVLGDVEVERDETVELVLTGVDSRLAVVDDTPVAGTIINDDVPLVSFREGTAVPEGSASGTLVFVLELSSPPVDEVRVSYASIGGTASAGADYAPVSGTAVFPAGVTEFAIPVVLLGDDLDELDETVVLEVTPVDGALPGVRTRATGTILDDDDPPAVSVRGGGEVLEGDAGGEALLPFVFSLDRPSGLPVAVDYLSGGSTGRLVFPLGAMSLVVDVVVPGDDVVESDEMVVVSITGVENGVLGSATSATGRVIDDDLPVLSLRGAAVPEGDSGTTTLLFAAFLSEAAFGDVTASYAVSGGTASAGSDYSDPGSGSLVIRAGATSTTVGIPVFGDVTVEGDETVELALSSVAGAGEGILSASGVIRNDDLPVVSLSGGSVAEGHRGTVTPLVFTARLSQPPVGEVRADWSVTGGTATMGTDFVSANGTLVFEAGRSMRTFAVPVTGDDVLERDETVEVKLSGVRGAETGTSTAAGVIVDDDDASVSIGDAEVVEGASGATATLVFPVRVDPPLFEGVSGVRWRTIGGGTAEPGVDYVVSSGALSFVPGVGDAEVRVTVLDDGGNEPDETVLVELLDPDPGIALSGGPATGTIRDDDAPFVSLLGGGATEPDSGTADLVFIVRLSEASVRDVHVDYSVVGGTASEGVDYRLNPGTLLIPAGDREAVLVALVAADDEVEFNETVRVDLSRPVGARAGTSTAVGIIRDDDEAAFAIGPAEAREGASGTTAALVFPVTLTPPLSSGTGTVGWRVAAADGDAAPGVDFTSASGTLSFGRGVGTREVSVAVNGDDMDEFDETVVVVLEDPGPRTALGAARGAGVIRDDDPAPALSLSSAGVAEGDTGTSSLLFTARLGAASGKEVTAGYRDAGAGTAAAGADYERLPAGVLAFAPGEVERTFAVAVRGDTAYEADETVVAELFDPVHATLAGGTAAGTVRNDDPPRLDVRAAEVLEGGPGATTSLVFAVRLEGPARGEVTVRFAVEGGTATAGGDFAAPPAGVLTIPAGGVSSSVAVTVLGDDREESDETVLLLLSEAANAVLATSSAAGVILDDDGSPGGLGIASPGVLSIGPAEVAEGDPGGTAYLVFRVRLDPAAFSEVRVAWATRDGTATAGEDYAAAAGTLAFAPGDTERTITVAVRGDSIGEGDETVLVALGEATGPAALGTSTAAGTIRDDDEDFGVSGVDPGPAGPVGMRISVAPPVRGGVGEGHDGDRTPMLFPVLLSGPAPETITAAGVFEGTATAGADYEIPLGRVTLAPGATSTAFEVVVLGDRLAEGDETVSVRLVEATGGAALDGTAATGVIRDDDASPSALSLPRARVLSPATMMEGSGGAARPLAFTMVLDRPAEAPVSADYATVGGAAAAGEDFLPSSGTLVIPPGATSTTMEVTVLGDDAFEADEAFFVEFTNLAGASFGSAVDPASRTAAPVASMRTTTVIMNDDAPGLAVSSDGVREGRAGATSTLVFVLSIPGPAPAPVVVPYSVRGGTARAGEDFAVSGGTATIPVGESSVAVGISVFGDDVFEHDETVVLEVGAVRGATAAEREAEGLILRDEPGLAIGAGEVVEGASGTTASIAFPVTLDHSASGTVAVAWATRDGTATAGEDYAAAAGTLSFAAGETSGTVRVSVLGDGIDEPDETFLVALSAPSGGAGILVAEAAGTIRDDDRSGPEFRTMALVRALAGFSGAVGADVAGFVRERAAGVRDSYAVVGGRVVDGVQSLAGLLGVGDTPEGLLRDAERVLRAGGGLRDFLRPPDGAALTGRTRFARSWGGGGSSFAVWGRGQHTSFGSDFDGLEMDGEVDAGSIGMDAFSPRSGLLAGFAVRHAEGGADYAFGDGGPEGRIETVLTSLHPYLHWTSPSGLGLWGAAGYGTGEARAGDEAGDVAMRMAAVGARGPLAGGGMHDVALKLDAFAVGMSAADGIFAGAEADSSRVRVALEGRTSAAYGTGEFTARLDLGARHDGGDGVRGDGLDAGFGLAWDSLGGGLDMSGQGSLVLDHEEESLREWAFGFGLAWDPGIRRRGASLSLSPAWGTRDGGGARLDARLGYGIGILEGRGGIEMFGEFGRERAGRRLRLGADFRSEGGDGLRAGVYGEHRRGDREVGVEAGIAF